MLGERERERERDRVQEKQGWKRKLKGVEDRDLYRCTSPITYTAYICIYLYTLGWSDLELFAIF